MVADTKLFFYLSFLDEKSVSVENGDGLSKGLHVESIIGKEFSYNDLYSLDKFVEILDDKTIFVRKIGRKYRYGLSYKKGFIIIKSRFRKKTVNVKNISSCVRKGYMLVIETCEYGLIKLIVENLSHASLIEKVLLGFVEGVYGY